MASVNSEVIRAFRELAQAVKTGHTIKIGAVTLWHEGQMLAQRCTRCNVEQRWRRRDAIRQLDDVAKFMHSHLHQEQPS